MVVLILERVPPGLRGELTRWFLEPQAGVFVGRVSAMVRDRLWEKACAQAKGGGCLILYSSDNEQGFVSALGAVRLGPSMTSRAFFSFACRRISRMVSVVPTRVGVNRDAGR